MRYSLSTALFIFSFFSIGNVFADTQIESTSTSQNSWAIGMIYPGASIKHYAGNHAWEFKAQAGSGIVAAGPRYYQYLSSNAHIRPFWAIEMDLLSFKTDAVKGGGFAAGWFAGGEIKISDRLGLVMDFGPMYLNLSENKYSQSDSGIDYVLNMGLYWYFK